MERIKLIFSRCAATGQGKELFPGLIKKRGMASEQDVQALLSVGFSRLQMLKVVQGLALKTLSNFTNKLADMPVDVAFTAEGFRDAGLKPKTRRGGRPASPHEPRRFRPWQKRTCSDPVGCR